MPAYPDDWGADETNLWENIAGDHRGDDREYLADDSHAMALFEAGWIIDTDEMSPDMRQAIRDEFFDYAIEQGYFEDRDDFDWAEWRAYMGY